MGLGGCPCRFLTDPGFAVAGIVAVGHPFAGMAVDRPSFAVVGIGPGRRSPAGPGGWDLARLGGMKWGGLLVSCLMNTI